MRLQTQDPPAARLLWQEVERDLLAQAPLLPTDNRYSVNFLSQRVGNFQYTRNGDRCSARSG